MSGKWEWWVCSAMASAVVAAAAVAEDCSVLLECWQACWLWSAFRDPWIRCAVVVAGFASARPMVADKWNLSQVREN